MTTPPTAVRDELVVFYSGKGTRVRVIRETVRAATVLRVEWYSRGLRRVRDYPDTKDGFDSARSLAHTTYNAKLAGNTPTSISIGDLWKRYQKAEFAHLGPATRKNYTHAWLFFERFLGNRSRAETITHDKLDELRDELRAQRNPPLSVRMTQDVFGMIRRVYRWAEGRELIGKNRPESYRYKVPKKDRTQARDEYAPDERDRILAQLDPHHSREWRAHVALVICGMQGARQHAVLHLTWDDIDEANKLVTWQAEWDKMGNTWDQPLRELTLAAIQVAREWRARIGYTGPYILPPARSHNRTGHYTKQALAMALQKAEKRAGVAHKLGRGPHGMRRTVSGDVSAESGDPMLGLHAIGDNDARMASKYIRPRAEKIRAVFDTLDEKRREQSGHPPMKPSTNRQQG